MIARKRAQTIKQSFVLAAVRIASNSKSKLAKSYSFLISHLSHMREYYASETNSRDDDDDVVAIERTNQFPPPLSSLSGARTRPLAHSLDRPLRCCVQASGRVRAVGSNRRGPPGRSPNKPIASVCVRACATIVVNAQ